MRSTSSVVRPAALPPPSSAAPDVVMGRRVPEAEEGSVRSGGTGGTAATGRSGASRRIRFNLSRYVEEIPEVVPAFVIWVALKDGTVRLTAREPLFMARRGFYGQLNAACTAERRPYYTVNVVAFRGPIAAEQPMEGFARSNEGRRRCLVFRMHYSDPDRDGLVRTRFDVWITIEVDHSGNLMRIERVSVRIHGSTEALCMREFHALPETRETTSRTQPRQLPMLMFTPELFKAIPRPQMPWTTYPATRRQCMGAWQGLRDRAVEDWQMYARMKGDFERDYRRQLRKLVDGRLR